MAVTFIVSPKVRRFEDHFPPIFLTESAQEAQKSHTVEEVQDHRKTSGGLTIGAMRLEHLEW